MHQPNCSKLCHWIKKTVVQPANLLPHLEMYFNKSWTMSDNTITNDNRMRLKCLETLLHGLLVGVAIQKDSF